MITQDLITYIRLERAKGTTDAVIRTNLASQGWTPTDIEEGINFIGGKPASTVQTVTSPDLKKYRRSRMWAIFIVVLVVNFAIFGGTGALSEGSLLGGSGLLLIGYALIMLLASFVASNLLGTRATGAKDILYTAAGCIAAFVLTWVFSLGLFFFTCLFGGLGSL
jgi:hypothetical protein